MFRILSYISLILQASWDKNVGDYLSSWRFRIFMESSPAQDLLLSSGSTKNHAHLIEQYPKYPQNSKHNKL